MVNPRTPVVPPGGIIETPMVHHIHHLPVGKSRTRRERDISDSEDSDSDEGYVVPRRYDIVVVVWLWHFLSASAISHFSLGGEGLGIRLITDKLVCLFVPCARELKVQLGNGSSLWLSRFGMV